MAETDARIVMLGPGMTLLLLVYHYLIYLVFEDAPTVITADAAMILETRKAALSQGDDDAELPLYAQDFTHFLYTVWDNCLAIPRRHWSMLQG